MERRAWLAVLAVTVGLSASCGSRTGLLLPGQGGSGSGSGGSGGGGGTPLSVRCSAALLAGAPTPMQGYCPTRANQAPGNAPQAPRIAWAVTPFPIDVPESFLPAEIVVDPAGRAYALIDASPMNPTGMPNQVFGIDPDGTVGWATSLSGPAADLTLGSDGKLWLVGSAPAGANGPICPSPDGGSEVCVASLTALSTATGASLDLLNVIVQQEPYAINSDYGAMTLASDGSFLLETVTAPYTGQGGVARVSTTGTVEWQWPAFGGPGLDVVPPLVVGPNDDVVGTDGINVVLIGASGNQIWQVDVDAQVAAVGPQGNVVALSTDTTSLLTLDGNGNTLQTIPLAATIGMTDAALLAVAGDGTMVVLLANEASSPGITKAEVQVLAVDASGTTRWTTTLDVSLPYDPAALATHYGLFIDGAGTVVVTAGAVFGLDLATGSTLWTLQPPNPKACLRPAVLGAGGAILASQCDGTVFLARDP